MTAGRAIHARWTVAIIVAACLSGVGCATVPADPVARAVFEEENDPLEPLNRVTYDWAQTTDRRWIKPVVDVYREEVPTVLQRGFHNFVANLDQPVTAVNDVLQGNLRRAAVAVGRFVINSTLGLAGMADVAADDFGLPGHTADFGQTFGMWGIGEGPYLYLPLFGPSNPRDALGLVLGVMVNPLSLLPVISVEEIALERIGGQGFDQRSQNARFLELWQRDSLDFYATLRSAYRQHRADRIWQAEVGSLDTLAAGASSAAQPGSAEADQ